MNSVLRNLTVEQLALALTGEPRLPMNEVLDECRRRQRQLEAAEGMAVRLIDLDDSYHNHETPEWRAVFGDAVQLSRAYTAAKGDR